MGKLFNPDSKTYQILSAASAFIALNLLFLLCCLPVFTIGTSAAAMYTVERKIARRESPAVAEAFFRAFRENFKKAFPLTLLLLVPLALAGGGFLLSSTGLLRAPNWFPLLCLLALAIVSVVWTYIWPLTAWFENGLGNTVRNAMLIPFSNPFVALICTALNLLPFWLMYRNAESFLRLSFLWIVAGFSLTAFLNTQLLRLQLRAYLPEDEFVRPLKPEDQDITEDDE